MRSGSFQAALPRALDWGGTSPCYWQAAVCLNSAKKDCVLLVYEFKKHDMTVTFTRREDTEPIVLLALGSEMRAFELGEFTDFWLSMIEDARKTHSEYLEALQDMARGKRKRKSDVTPASDKNESSIASEIE